MVCLVARSESDYCDLIQAPHACRDAARFDVPAQGSGRGRVGMASPGGRGTRTQVVGHRKDMRHTKNTHAATEPFVRNRRAATGRAAAARRSPLPPSRRRDTCRPEPHLYVPIIRYRLGSCYAGSRRTLSCSDDCNDPTVAVLFGNFHHPPSRLISQEFEKLPLRIPSFLYLHLKSFKSVHQLFVPYDGYRLYL